MLPVLFWIGILAAAGLTVAHVMGYNVLQYAIGVLIVDVVLLEVSRAADKKLFTNDLKHEFTVRITNLESLVNGLTNTLQANSLEKMEDKLRGHRNEIRIEFSDSLDRMAKKAIDIENRLTQMRNTFSSAIASFDDRIRSLESQDTSEFIEEIEGIDEL